MLSQVQARVKLTDPVWWFKNLQVNNSACRKIRAVWEGKSHQTKTEEWLVKKEKNGYKIQELLTNGIRRTCKKYPEKPHFAVDSSMSWNWWWVVPGNPMWLFPSTDITQENQTFLGIELVLEHYYREHVHNQVTSGFKSPPLEGTPNSRNIEANQQISVSVMWKFLPSRFILTWWWCKGLESHSIIKQFGKWKAPSHARIKAVPMHVFLVEDYCKDHGPRHDSPLAAHAGGERQKQNRAGHCGTVQKCWATSEPVGDPKGMQCLESLNAIWPWSWVLGPLPYGKLVTFSERTKENIPDCGGCLMSLETPKKVVRNGIQRNPEWSLNFLTAWKKHLYHTISQCQASQEMNTP